MKNKQILIGKIKNRKSKIAIIGLGYVGLPLAVLFAKKGFYVNGYSKTDKRIGKIKNGDTEHTELNKDIKKLQKDGLLRVHKLSTESLKSNDVFIICLPTPVNTKKQPDLKALKQSAAILKKIPLTNKLIINESTVAPFMTQKIYGEIGKNYFLACSPERVDPGNKEKATEFIPKLIGAIDDDSLKVATLLYKTILKKNIVIVKDMQTAEMSKMLENTYRAVNIALINEFALLADKLDMDIEKVITAAKSKWSFQPHYPGIGVGGHCIPVDPYYVLKLANDSGINLSMIQNSLKVNESMPSYVLGKIKKIYKKGMKVHLYGITYKKNVADLRESPSLELCKLMNASKIDFQVYDPLISEESINNLKLRFSKPGICDLFIIGTDHDNLKTDYKKFVDNNTTVIDGKNYFKRKVGKNLIGIGRSFTK